ncbi:TniQ family protein [Brucella abortus]|uniref:TniQ family protein n=1 Tax=Brucella abortus TaxID=235 RepID=UPI0002CE2C16|nr:TniQ family protein [Brucella abortus]ENR70772.1 hypothetical protein C032_00664 [Brucella abortus 63/294]ENS10799.1 hypothetical protein C980_01485 [Brucella abortus 88/217]ERU10773.1 hypothetical protein P039_00651 [Brucella abortus 07-0994-2411]
MTIARLALTCELADRETPTSFASRLAVRNMVGSAGEFCLDVGLNWKSLRMGNSTEIARLSAISRASPPDLQRYAFRSLGQARQKIGRGLATNRSVHRMSAKLCPVCLTESVAATGFSGAFRRLDWQFVAIKSCDIHQVALINLPAEKFATHAYDFARVVQKHWRTVQQAAISPLACKETSLEQYIRKRLSGWKGTDWLDRLSLPAIAKASETLGVRVKYGAYASSQGVGNIDSQTVSQVGFEVLKKGADGLLTALAEFKAERRSPHASHNRDLGCFFLWLSREGSISGIEPIRKIVRDFVIENYPVVTGTAILGHRVDQPACFTLGKVEKELGLRQERLIHMLSELSPISWDAANPPTYVTRDQVQLLRGRIGDIVPLVRAGQIIGCSYHFVTTFIAAGMIKRRRDAANKTYLYRSDLEAFVKPVNELPLAAENPTQVSIYDVSRSIKRSVSQIYECFLKNRLSSACRMSEKFGIDALLLDPDEVRDMLVLPHQESDLRLFEATRRLRINTRTLQFLIKDGYLRVYKAANPNTKTFRHYIKVDDVRKFERNFSTLGSLRDEFGQISHGGICAKIRVLGIHPIYAKDGISTIYHRKDAERAIRTIEAKNMNIR